MQKQELITALANWPELNAFEWDLVATLHIPTALQARSGSKDHIALQKLLGRYFNIMDRRLFKNAFKRRGIRTKRFVVLEYQEGLGWHAHMLLRTPDQLPQARYQAMLHQQWLYLTEQYATPAFRPHLFWAQSYYGGNYIQYCLKHACKDAGLCASRLPASAVGLVDAHNTHLG